MWGTELQRRNDGMNNITSKISERAQVEWECRTGAESVFDLDPHAGDSVVDYACDEWSLRWDALARQCRDNRLVLVFESFDEDEKCNRWTIRAAKMDEEYGSCIGI